MKTKIVADSSANLKSLKHTDFESVPLTIITDNKEYRDDDSLDIQAFINDLISYKGKSSTACPGIGDWTHSFADADRVFAISITSKLSGSYNSARIAADMYMDQHPDRKVFVIDSLSAGPELDLIAEKLDELNGSGFDFDTICEKITAYTKRTRLEFSLASLNNLARNGRVNGAVAKIVQALNIRIVGKAEEGELASLNKCRGDKRSFDQILKNMMSEGFKGGKVRISHTNCPDSARLMRDTIEDAFPFTDISISPNRALCSYYAENGSIMIGFETN